VRDVGARVMTGMDADNTGLARELDLALDQMGEPTPSLEAYPLVRDALQWLDEADVIEPNRIITGLEEQLRSTPEGADPEVLADYRFSAIEFLGATLMTSKVVDSYRNQDLLFIPRRMEP
jgi:hypothetical protein